MWLWISFLSTSIGLLYEDEVLPRAMTCGNMLQLPSYSSKEPEFFWNKHETVTACDNRYPADVTTDMCAELHIYAHMIIWLWYTAWKWNRWINNISAIGLQLAVASCQHCGKNWMPPYLQYKNAPRKGATATSAFEGLWPGAVNAAGVDKSSADGVLQAQKKRLSVAFRPSALTT